MPKQRLDIHQVQTLPQQPGRKPMPQTMQAQICRQPSAIAIAREHPAQPPIARMLHLPPLRPCDRRPDPVRVDSPPRDVPLPPHHPDPRRSDIDAAQPQYFSPTKPSIRSQQIHDPGTRPRHAEQLQQLPLLNRSPRMPNVTTHRATPLLLCRFFSLSQNLTEGTNPRPTQLTIMRRYRKPYEAHPKARHYGRVTQDHTTARNRLLRAAGRILDTYLSLIPSRRRNWNP
jgi:hypothetical protein